MTITPTSYIHGVRTIAPVSVSPDARWIVFNRTVIDAESGERQSNLWLIDVEDDSERQLTWQHGSRSSLAWSPDGRSVAFAATDQDKKSRIFALSLDGGEAQPLSQPLLMPSDLSWSPDGTSIAFTTVIDPQGELAEDRDRLAPRVILRPDYRRDGAGRSTINEARRQVAVLNVESGEHEVLTEGPLDHAAPKWSPDGSKIGFTLVRELGVRSQLIVFDLATRETQLIGEETGTIGLWVWTEDSSSIVFAQGTTYSVLNDFQRFDVATSSLTAIGKVSPWYIDSSGAVWLDETHLAFHGEIEGHSALIELDTIAGSVREMVEYDAELTGFSVDAGKRYVAQSSTGNAIVEEIVLTDLSTLQTTQISTTNMAYFAAHHPAQVESRWVDRDGTPIQYWLSKPADFDPAATYPVVLEIHGGPHSAHGEGMRLTQQFLTSAGYIVVSPNPRGSVGYGEEFARGCIGDWGGGDWLDLLAALDDACTLPFVDADRQGVWGYSYGGYMTAWAIGQTDRFKAAIAGAGVADLISDMGTSDMGYFVDHVEYGVRMEDAREMLIAQSPVTHLHRAVTPTLLLHGEHDVRCEIGQSELLFALLSRAGVETELVRYPEASHTFPWTGPTSQRIDFWDRVIAWFDKYLKPIDRIGGH